jgi:hypothetical protein
MYIFKCGFVFFSRYSFHNMLLQATGLPLESKAGVQCNLVMKDVNSYDRAAPFSNKYIPLFWLQLVSVMSLVVRIVTYRIC